MRKKAAPPAGEQVAWGKTLYAAYRDVMDVLVHDVMHVLVEAGPHYRLRDRAMRQLRRAYLVLSEARSAVDGHFAAESGARFTTRAYYPGGKKGDDADARDDSG